MAEASSANYKVGDRITATSAELNGQLGTIKYVGAVNSLPSFPSLLINFPRSSLVKKELGSVLSLMYTIIFQIPPSH